MNLNKDEKEVTKISVKIYERRVTTNELDKNLQEEIRKLSSHIVGKWFIICLCIDFIYKILYHFNISYVH